MTAPRLPNGYLTALVRHTQEVLASPDPEPKREPEWSVYPGLAKAILRKAQRAGLDRKRGGLERWHNINRGETV